MQLGALNHREHYQPIEEEARLLVLDDPNLSVDSIARALSKRYRNESITKANISRIRNLVRQTISKAQRAPGQPPLKKTERPGLAIVPEPFNSIRWGRTTETVEPNEVVPSDTMQHKHFPSKGQTFEQRKVFSDGDGKARAFPDSTHGERIKFLEDYALNHIHATIEQAREALKQHFGQAVGTKAISDALATVKAIAKTDGEGIIEQPPKMVDGKPRSTAIQECVETMRAYGIRQITLMDDGYHIKDR